jgi:hypothetical protein
MVYARNYHKLVQLELRKSAIKLEKQVKSDYLWEGQLAGKGKE